MSVQQNLSKLNLQLPSIAKPGGSYSSVNVRGKIAYVAIQFPILDNGFLYQGSLGKEVFLDDGYKAAQLCALNILTQIEHYIGFDKIDGLNHFDAHYVASTPWDEAPRVVNGASDLFLNVLGQKGQHSRSIYGVQSLPRNFCIGITASFTLL